MREIPRGQNRPLEQPIRRQGFASLRPAAARSRVQPYFIAIYINIQQTSFPSLNRRTLSIQWRTSLIMGSSLAMSADLVLLPLEGTNTDHSQWINLARFSNECLLIISDSSPVGGQNGRNLTKGCARGAGKEENSPLFLPSQHPIDRAQKTERRLGTSQPAYYKQLRTGKRQKPGLFCAQEASKSCL